MFTQKNLNQLISFAFLMVLSNAIEDVRPNKKMANIPQTDYLKLNPRGIEVIIPAMMMMALMVWVIGSQLRRCCSPSSKYFTARIVGENRIIDFSIAEKVTKNPLLEMLPVRRKGFSMSQLTALLFYTAIIKIFPKEKDNIHLEDTKIVYPSRLDDLIYRLNDEASKKILASVSTEMIERGPSKQQLEYLKPKSKKAFEEMFGDVSAETASRENIYKYIAYKLVYAFKENYGVVIEAVSFDQNSEEKRIKISFPKGSFKVKRKNGELRMSAGEFVGHMRELIKPDTIRKSKLMEVVDYFAGINKPGVFNIQYHHNVIYLSKFFLALSLDDMYDQFFADLNQKFDGIIQKNNARKEKDKFVPPPSSATGGLKNVKADVKSDDSKQKSASDSLSIPLSLPVSTTPSLSLVLPASSVSSALSSEVHNSFSALNGHSKDSQRLRYREKQKTKRAYGDLDGSVSVGSSVSKPAASIVPEKQNVSKPALTTVSAKPDNSKSAAATIVPAKPDVKKSAASHSPSLTEKQKARLAEEKRLLEDEKRKIKEQGFAIVSKGSLEESSMSLLSSSASSASALLSLTSVKIPSVKRHRKKWKKPVSDKPVPDKGRVQASEGKPEDKSDADNLLTKINNFSEVDTSLKFQLQEIYQALSNSEYSFLVDEIIKLVEKLYKTVFEEHLDTDNELPEFDIALRITLLIGARLEADKVKAVWQGSQQALVQFVGFIAACKTNKNIFDQEGFIFGDKRVTDVFQSTCKIVLALHKEEIKIAPIKLLPPGETKRGLSEESETSQPGKHGECSPDIESPEGEENMAEGWPTRDFPEEWSTEGLTFGARTPRP